MTKRANPIDVLVGQNIRAIRVLRDHSQQALADAVDITFQQVQKYEKGTNRVSASRLWQFAEFLNVPVSSFFMDSPTAATTKALEGHTPHPEAASDKAPLPTLTASDLKLARRINELPTEARTKISNLITVLSKSN